MDPSQQPGRSSEIPTEIPLSEMPSEARRVAFWASSTHTFSPRQAERYSNKHSPSQRFTRRRSSVSHTSVASISYEETSVKDVILKFFSMSTAHGLGQVAEEPKVMLKVMWAVIFIIALVLGFGLVIVRVVDFTKYTTVEQVAVVREPLVFPDVTVCNIAAISTSNAERLMKDNKSDLKAYTDMIGSGFLEELSRKYNQSYNADLFRSPLLIFQNVDQDELVQLGHSFDDFILDCKFASRSCLQKKLFVHRLNGEYFNCYTFSADHALGNSTGVVGPDGGLSLLLYLESNPMPSPNFDYYDRGSVLFNSLGARVSIHRRNTLSLPRLKGEDIMPGQSTSFALSTVRDTHAGLPWGNCTKEGQEDWFADTEYNTLVCLRLCAQEYVFNKCGCLSGRLPTPKALINRRYCGAIPRQEPDVYFQVLQCPENALKNFYAITSSPDINCGCFAACDELQYVPSMSSSPWPAPHYQDSFYKKYVMDRPDRHQLNAFQRLSQLPLNNRTFEGTDLIQKNFARLNVYFRSLELVSHRDVPAYPLTALISDIGGALGFWLGMSTISIIEVFYFSARLSLILGNKIRKS